MPNSRVRSATSKPSNTSVTGTCLLGVERDRTQEISEAAAEQRAGRAHIAEHRIDAFAQFPDRPADDVADRNGDNSQFHLGDDADDRPGDGACDRSTQSGRDGERKVLLLANFGDGALARLCVYGRGLRCCLFHDVPPTQ